MKVLWLANIPSPYTVNFLNELGKLCELTVLFELKDAKDRDNSWKNYQFQSFNGIFLKGIRYSSDKALCFSVKKYLKQKYDVIVVSNMATLTGILAVNYMRRHKIDYIIQGDGGFKKNKKGLKEKLKEYLISGAKYCLSTGQAHDEYYCAYGAKKENIFRIPFTSLYEKDIEKTIATQSEKQAKKELLGIKEEKVVLSVGQFIYRKGFDVLIDATSKLEKDVGVYIVGGQPTQEYIKQINLLHLTIVHFLDFMPPSELKNYYRVADVFVLPTREDIWGLVINEAMSNGLPVVTTNNCMAGLELVENDKNGYVVSVDNSQELANAITKILNDENYQLFCKNSLEKIQDYTIENVAKVHFDIFNKII